MKINDRAESLSEILRRALTSRRTAVGLSKNETAARAALSVSFVSDLEHGKRKPSVETLAKLAWVFGTTASDILRDCERELAQSEESS